MLLSDSGINHRPSYIATVATQAELCGQVRLEYVS